ncbi:MAG: hypothetical protein M3Q22_12215 [Actinomycetota bacterium]|nr:hypothetical protein [Actinomycetota bacterium]
MLRTTKALMRLGVPVLAAVTLVGGTPALLGAAHAAAPPVMQTATSTRTIEVVKQGNDTATSTVATSKVAVNNVQTDEDRRFLAVVDDTGSATTTVGTAVTFAVTGGSGDETVTLVAGGLGDAGATAGTCTTDNLGTTADTNDSACEVVVRDPTPSVRQPLSVTFRVTGTTATDVGTLRFANPVSAARFVVVTPDGATTTVGTNRTFTAAVTAADGTPVEGVPVTFSRSGVGGFTGTTSATATVSTNVSGAANVTTTSSVAGTLTVTGTIPAATTACDAPAGTGGTPPAGDCSDTGSAIFVLAPPPPPPATGTVTVEINTPIITAGGRGSVTLTGPANADVVLEAYSRPNTTYRVVRTGTLSALGTLDFENLVPSGNTRLRARVVGGQFAQSAVILVRSRVSARAERLATRTYRFTGRVLPARTNQMVFIYRGNVLATVARVRSDGIYAVNRRFLGTGTFNFTARTGTDITNVGGVSQTFRVAIR